MATATASPAPSSVVDPIETTLAPAAVRVVSGHLERRVLLLTPTGRDGRLLEAALSEAGLEAYTCSDMAQLCAAFREGAGCVIVAEEALRPAAVRQLQAAVADEATWSDLPLIILTSDRLNGHSSRLTVEQLGSLGNVTVLDRPVQRAILLRAVRVALRARDRQYERRKSSEALEASLREKEVLLREIHHRVKNNLQIISSLLSLQADSFDDRTIAGYFQESQARIHSMALVHEKLYGTEDLSSIKMRGYVESLSRHLVRTYNLPGVRLDIDVDDMAFDIDTAIPCALILNELITNALKYAFPGGRTGRVLVRLKFEPGDVRLLEVKDDGVGLPEAANPSKSKSLGLRLVQALARQVGGSLSVHREPGAAFSIQFPGQRLTSARPTPPSAPDSGALPRGSAGPASRTGPSAPGST